MKKMEEFWLLEELKRKQIKIPILGNSSMGVKLEKKYDNFKGQMYLWESKPKVIEKFIENILKEHPQ